MPALATAKRPTRRTARRPDLGLKVSNPRALNKVTRGENAGIYERYAICRAEGHEWRHHGRSDGLRAAPRFADCYPFNSSCSNCGTERTKWFTRSGRSAGTEYRYADDYAQRGDDKLDRDDWGKLFIRSVLGSAA